MQTGRLIKTYAISVFGLIFSGQSAEAEAGEPRSMRHPNILFIPVDDLKPILGCYGDSGIITPNIDRIASRGMVFLNAHCQFPQCSPSRASLLTGLYPDEIRIWDHGAKIRDQNPDVLTLPQFFRRQGYVTAGIGKTFDHRTVDRKHDEPSWSVPYITREHHLGGARHYVNPETLELWDRGMRMLEEAGRTNLRGWPRRQAIAELVGPGAWPATESADVPDNAYHDGVAAEEGVRLLRELSAQDSPFFLSVAFSKPHLAFAAPKRYWDLYDRDKIPLAPFQQKAKDSPEVAYRDSPELRKGYTDIPLTGDLSPELQRRLIHGYMACVSFIDAQIGKLLDAMDELGIADNTIICLWGDHGFHLGDHGLWAKRTNFEQATRSPLIIAAPGMPGALQNRSPVEFTDVFPTLADLAGFSVPEHLSGHSLKNLMSSSDPSTSVREAAMTQERRSVDRLRVMGYSLRSSRYRYTKWIQMDYRRGAPRGLLIAAELYDYETDPLETVNLAEREDVLHIVGFFENLFRERGVAQHTGKYSGGGTGRP